MAENESIKHKELWIRIIEKQECLEDKFYNIKRIDPQAGNGNFSLVFTAKDKNSKGHTPVALKFLNPLETDHYRQQSFHREAQLLEKLTGQDNILPLIGKKNTVNILIEQIPYPLHYYATPLGKSTIEKYIYGQDSNYLTTILHFREMCKAIQRIHSSQICHRDLKPDNYIIFEKRNVCLGDFGTARHCGKGADTLIKSYMGPVGDLRYTAPELLCGLHFTDDHNYCADIYSLGAILFEMFTKMNLSETIYNAQSEVLDIINNFNQVPEGNRRMIFDEYIDTFSNNRTLYKTSQYNGSIPKHIANIVDDLYKSMACLNYNKREVNFDKIFIKINVLEKNIRINNKYEELKKGKAKND